MDTVIVSNGQFYSHYPKNIAKGTVDAEAVLVRLDSEWDNLTVRIHWLNVVSAVEKVVLLERAQPNTIPWEVLTDLGELRMGLDGMDGGTVVKPTVWLTYGYVVEGVDPEAGDDPQPPTPSWEQQMVEQATAAANAAKKAKETADNLQAAAEAGEFNGDPGPAGPAGLGLPTPTQEDAGKVPMVNPEGNGYIFGEAGGGGAGGKLIVVYVHQGNAEYNIESLDFETGVVQCPEAHGLSEPTKVMIVPNDWTNNLYNYAAPYIPVEWLTYTGAIYLLPVTETSFMVVGNDKETPITIDPDGEYNGTMDVTKLHFEAPVNWEINGIDKLIKTSRIHLSMYGFALPGVNRYTQVNTTPNWGNYVGIQALDTAVKSRYMLFSVVDVDVDIPNQGAGYYIGNTWAGGRRPNYPTGFWDTVQKEVGGVLGILKFNETERVINQIRNYPGYATWSNGSVIRVFATGVFE